MHKVFRPPTSFAVSYLSSSGYARTKLVWQVNPVCHVSIKYICAPKCWPCFLATYILNKVVAPKCVQPGLTAYSDNFVIHISTRYLRSGKNPTCVQKLLKRWWANFFPCYWCYSASVVRWGPCIMFACQRSHGE